MKSLLGVCNNGLLTIQQLLSEYAKEHKTKYKIQTLGFGDEVHKKQDFILVYSMHQLVKNYPALKKSNAVVFILDSPMLLEYVQPIEVLDLGERKLSYMYSFKALTYLVFADAVTRALASTTKINITREKFEVIPTMLGAQLSSVLNPIQTFLYSIRDTDKRLHYQKIVYTWLVSGAPIKKLEIGMMKLHEGKTTPIAMTRLLEVLGEPKFAAMRLAFQEAFDAKAGDKDGKKKAVNYTALSKKHGVDTFDIRYTMKAIRRFGTFSNVKKDVADIYKEHVATSKQRRAAQEETEV